MKRFAVVGFPSIYLLKDGSTWQYTGMRTVADVSMTPPRRATATCLLKYARELISAGAALHWCALAVCLRRVFSMWAPVSPHKKTELVVTLLNSPVITASLAVTMLPSSSFLCSHTHTKPLHPWTTHKTLHTHNAVEGLCVAGLQVNHESTVPQSTKQRSGQGPRHGVQVRALPSCDVCTAGGRLYMCTCSRVYSTGRFWLAISEYTLDSASKLFYSCSVVCPLWQHKLLFDNGQRAQRTHASSRPVLTHFNPLLHHASWGRPSCTAVDPVLCCCSIPAFARRGYLFLKDDKGFSDTAIISGVLLVPLMFGAVFICVLDAMYTRRGGAFEDGHHHEHHE